MIVDDVIALWTQIRATSWAALFQAHGVDPDVRTWDKSRIRPDRSQPGFEDFALDATLAIEPGDPAKSLIYHALASSSVHPRGKDWYPTLAQLDLIENYIYSLKRPTPDDIRMQELVPAVFAYEYRIKGKSTHGRHADLVFSRTGVARLGSRPTRWDGSRRCFMNDNGPQREFAVTPARYGVFLARRVKGDEDSLTFMGTRHDKDEDRFYLAPVHKLFAGSECVAGRDLAIDFSEMHINEKLQRLARIGDIELAPGLDTNRAPFIRRSLSRTGAPAPADAIVDLVKQGSSVTVGPREAPLVRLALQRQSTGADMVACFKVPRQKTILPDFDRNRSYTTLLMIESRGLAVLDALVTSISGRQRKVRPRNLPEFVSIRHRVHDPVDPASVEILGETLPDRKDYMDRVEDGGYWAALYEDGICEGAVGATIAGLTGKTTANPAYSLIAAPDFFPLADAMDLEEWVWAHTGDDGSSQFKEGGPEPLCFGRFPVNPAIRSPYGDGTAAFNRGDQTMVAIIGRPMKEARGLIASGIRDRTSFLTDAASNEFAPGWDISFGSDSDGHFYATYGLGSPFPEDVKLCAAANAYWPAASPDASRTFRRKTPTAIPLLDDELGYHPRHPKVLAGEATASRGWDGEYGPFFDKADDGTRVVNYADIMRSDYVSNVLKDRFDRSRLAKVDSEELIRRMDALRLCIQVLPPDGDKVSSTKLWLVSAERRDFGIVAQTPDTRLSGGGRGYKFEFVKVPDRLNDEDVTIDATSPGRLLQSFDGLVYTCYVCASGLCWQCGDDEPEYAPSPGRLFA